MTFEPATVSLTIAPSGFWISENAASNEAFSALPRSRPFCGLSASLPATIEFSSTAGEKPMASLYVST
jgi:hypothetical protein